MPTESGVTALRVGPRTLDVDAVPPEKSHSSVTIVAVHADDPVALDVPLAHDRQVEAAGDGEY